MLWLAALSIGVVAIAALLLAMGIHPEESEEAMTYIESFWASLNLALSPGGIKESGWAYRLVMISVSIVGILIVSTIIGVLTTGIEGRLDSLRRGRSLVIEQNHTVILGWSSKIDAAVKELVIANESCKRGVVVILADRDKVEMEEHIRDHVGDLKTTDVICRRGDPCDLTDLAIVRPELARSLILFAGDGEDGDALVLKRSMALMRIAEQSGQCRPIIAEVQEAENCDAVSRIGDVRVVQPAQLVTRVLLQAARQPGLSIVYDELFSFAGCEIYFVECAVPNGMSFDDAAMSFPKAAVIGVLPAEGLPAINPAGDTALKASDQLIMVAEDDSATGSLLDAPLSFDRIGIVDQPRRDPAPEHFIILGWHQWAHLLLDELDAQLPAGSVVRVIYDARYSDGPSVESIGTHEHISVSSQTARTSSRGDLRAIDLTAVDEIIVLSYRDQLSPQSADSRTLLTLVHLRECVTAANREIGIATELLDARNRALATRGREDDFIASEALVSNVMVQLSENPRLSSVFDVLLTAEGSELYLRDAADYVEIGTAVPFGAVVMEGLARGEAVIGILERTPGQPMPDLRLAIAKAELVTLGQADAFVVIAED